MEHTPSKDPPPASGAQAQAPGASPSPAQQGYVVVVLGASGGVGQPLSLLLKLTPGVRELRLYSRSPGVAGIAADLAHIPTPAHVSAHAGPQALGGALAGADLVLLPAGVAPFPGVNRDELYRGNCGIVYALAEEVARHSPGAWLAVITNPLNATVPLAAEVLRRGGALDPRRLFGVTTLDVMRANCLAAEALGLDPSGVNVPVVGGHRAPDSTQVPLLSAASPPVRLPAERARALIARIQNAGSEVVKAKGDNGSATLSMAAAAARFAAACLRAMAGESGVVECAFVASSLVPGLPYLASPLRLGPQGIAEFLPLPPMDEVERELFVGMQPDLAAAIQRGIEFAARQASQAPA